MEFGSPDQSSNASTPNRPRTRSVTSLERNLPGYTQNGNDYISPQRLSFLDGIECMMSCATI